MIFSDSSSMKMRVLGAMAARALGAQGSTTLSGAFAGAHIAIIQRLLLLGEAAKMQAEQYTAAFERVDEYLASLPASMEALVDFSATKTFGAELALDLRQAAVSNLRTESDRTLAGCRDGLNELRVSYYSSLRAEVAFAELKDLPLFKERFGREVLWSDGRILEVSDSLPAYVQQRLEKAQEGDLRERFENLKQQSAPEWQNALISKSDTSDSWLVQASSGGATAAIDRRYATYFLERYPGCQVMIVAADKPVFFLQHGRVVAAAMPLLVPTSKVKRATSVVSKKKTDALCSLFIPGLGQLLQGRYRPASWHFGLAVLFLLASAATGQSYILLGWIPHIFSCIESVRYTPASPPAPVQPPAPPVTPPVQTSLR